jgi:hypothetical protein
VSDFVLDFVRLTVLSLLLAGKSCLFIIVGSEYCCFVECHLLDWLAIIEHLYSLSVLDIV